MPYQPLTGLAASRPHASTVPAVAGFCSSALPERHPIAVRLKHRVQIFDAAELIPQLCLADLHDERRRIKRRITPRLIVRRSRRCLEFPRLLGRARIRLLHVNATLPRNPAVRKLRPVARDADFRPKASAMKAQMSSKAGFIAALDQSGGSRPGRCAPTASRTPRTARYGDVPAHARDARAHHVLTGVTRRQSYRGDSVRGDDGRRSTRQAGTGVSVGRSRRRAAGKSR